MSTISTTDPNTTTDMAAREWGVRITWADGDTEVAPCQSRLEAENRTEIVSRPGRASEAVYRIGSAGSWLAVPALQNRATVLRPHQPAATILRTIVRGAAEVALCVGLAGLGGLVVYMWLKGHRSI